MKMRRSTLAFIAAVTAGLTGLFLGAAINAEGYIGVILTVAVMGFFIIRTIEEKQ